MRGKLDYNPNDPLPDLNPGAGLGSKGVKRYLNVEALRMPAPGYFENKSAEVWRERAVIVIFNVSYRRINLVRFIDFVSLYLDSGVYRSMERRKFSEKSEFQLCFFVRWLCSKFEERYGVIEFTLHITNIIIHLLNNFSSHKLFLISYCWHLTKKKKRIPHSLITIAVRSITLYEV